jgi:ubiquitin C-terminal hydrolase
MVGIIKEDFNNTEQQDANEYLNLVLENLHEELNLHSTKRYIEEKDDIFKHNTDEELGNISWANNLKRNTSFIDSLFMFQLKSNLKCRKCKNTKINFETNYIFDLPLSLCKMVTVEIFLYRLPFIYKLYSDKINKNFANFIKNEKNKNLSMMNNLWNYYTNNLTIEEKKKHVIILHFSFDLEREKKK